MSRELTLADCTAQDGLPPDRSGPVTIFNDEDDAGIC